MDKQLIVANADDFGLRTSVNAAIIKCFRAGLINSVSLITNSPIFDETIALIKSEKYVKNIGLHVNLVEFKPLTVFAAPEFIDKEGNWSLNNANNKSLFLNKKAIKAFDNEICTQIEKGLSAGLTLVHLDSHYHVHTLPAFYMLFINAAKKYNLKLRLAQSYNEGNYGKFLYRKWLNNLIKKNGCSYTDLFQDVQYFLSKNKDSERKYSVEIMLHPDLDDAGNLTDHYDQQTMTIWMEYIACRRTDYKENYAGL
ncbi:carbohydrate deacetylase [Mucilaginibacter sp. HD30]